MGEATTYAILPKRLKEKVEAREPVVVLMNEEDGEGIGEVYEILVNRGYVKDPGVSYNPWGTEKVRYCHLVPRESLVEKMEEGRPVILDSVVVSLDKPGDRARAEEEGRVTDYMEYRARGYVEGHKTSKDVVLELYEDFLDPVGRLTDALVAMYPEHTRDDFRDGVLKVLSEKKMKPIDLNIDEAKEPEW